MMIILTSLAVFPGKGGSGLSVKSIPRNTKTLVIILLKDSCRILN
jgi:hypothetical protein